MSIPDIAFKSIKEAEDHVLALLEDELGQENLNPLEVYCKLLTANRGLMMNTSTLACLIASEHMEKHGFSDDSIRFMFSHISQDTIDRFEKEIVMDDPSITFVGRQVNLARCIVKYFNIG